MASLPTFEELRDRIQASASFYGGVVSRDAGLVWDGYIAALLEWGLISVDDHYKLCTMLPRIEDNPVIQLFLGWDDDNPQ